MKENTKDRILAFMKAQGLSQKRFEEACGLSNGYINNLKANPSANTIQKIMDRFPYINRIWLLTGEGTMLKGNPAELITNPKERIERMADYAGVSIKEFSEKCGYDRPQTFYDIVAGKTQNISAQMSDNIIAVFPEFNRSWLMTGEGDMLNHEQEVSDGDSLISYVDSAAVFCVPLLPVSARAGSLQTYATPAAKRICERVISPVYGAELAITVTGDSMSPEYPSGCKILIKKIDENEFIEWGKVFVLDTFNGILIKKVMPGSEPDTLKCVSINCDYPPFEVRRESIYSMYIVIMSMSEK